MLVRSLRGTACTVKPAKQELTPRQKKIEVAIDRGVVFVQNQQHNDGSWSKRGHVLGTTALCGLTLLECGVAADNAHVAAAAAIVRQRWLGNTATYDISLAILFLDKLGEKKDKLLIQALALRLIKGQRQDGGWNYDCPILTNAEATQLLTRLQKNRPKLPVAIDKSDKKPLQTPLDKGDKGPLQTPLDKKNKSALPIPIDKKGKSALPLPGQKDSKGPTTVDPGKSEESQLDFQNESNGDSFEFDALFQNGQGRQNAQKKGLLSKMELQRSDNSNTQFAMLGLWVARRHDVPVEKSLELCEKRVRLSQLRTGGWTYVLEQPQKGETPSMTCVGLLGIGLGRGSAAEMSQRAAMPADAKSPKAIAADEQVQRGLNALRLEKYRRDDQEWPRDLSLYFVWSVKHIGVLYDLTRIGDSDWYEWGVRHALAHPSRKWLVGYR